jgi:hypothetical protein
MRVSRVNHAPACELPPGRLRSGRGSRVVLAVLALAIPLHAEILPNGIVLPEVWPPRELDPSDARPMPVPYLADPPKVIPIDVGRQLFVDDFLIESTSLVRTLHQAQPFVGNPILKPETARELDGGKRPGAALHSGGVWFDHRDGWFKMWYMPAWYGGMAYARSRDGLAWERPRLNQPPGDNLLVIPDTKGRVPGTFNIWVDWYADDENERFKSWQFFRTGLSGDMLLSADGIHWRTAGPIGASDDKNTLFYNPFRKRWVYSIKAPKAPFRYRHYREHADFDLGRQWKPEEPVFWVRADERDEPAPEVGDTPQLYDLQCAAYESLVVGVFMIHKGPKNEICLKTGTPKLTEIMLGFSRDGFHWDRPDRRPFITPTKQAGDWDRTNLEEAGGGFLVVGDHLYFYYSAYNGEAPKGNDMYAGAATGVAFLRRDGFASMDAGGEPGQLTTRPLRFSGGHLFVNVDVPRGELRAEVVGVDGRVLDGFSRESSIPLTIDSTRIELRWEGADLVKLAGREVRLRFWLSNGRLYSFWITPHAEGYSRGYVAAGGPGLRGPVDSPTGF